MATVRYDASHEQIAEGGIGGIRAVLLGDYSCMPLSILEAGFSRVSEHRKPEVRALLDRP